MVTFNGSGTDQRITLQKLTLYNAAPRCVQRHPELKNQVPPLIQKENLTIMPKATRKAVIDIEEAEEEISLHGLINEDEAKVHTGRV